MTNEYTQPELLRMIADAQERRPGDWFKEFQQYIEEPSGKWLIPIDGSMVFAVLANHGPDYIRPKPRRRYAYTQDGTEVSWPEPVSRALEYWQIYFVADPVKGEAGMSRWNGDLGDWECLELGLIHLDLQSAEEHAKALVKLSGGTIPEG
jgi:hypothetical protein